MKNTPLRKAALFSFFLSLFMLGEVNINNIHAEPSSSQTPTGNFNSPVRASDYAAFLNAVAKNDTNFLYDEKVGSDFETASIVRFGMPGNFHYEVIAGREDEAIVFVNENDADAYSHWLANGAVVNCTPSNEENTLNSSCFTLYSTFISNGSCRLSLVSSSISHLPSSNETSTSTFNSYIEDISMVAGIIGLAAFGSGLVTMDDFRQAAADPSNTGVERLILSSNGQRIIRSDEAAFKVTSDDDQRVFQELQTTLEREHPSIDAAELIKKHSEQPGWLYGTHQLPLSTERLQRITSEVDRQIAVMTIEPISRSVRFEEDKIDDNVSIKSCASSQSLASARTTASMGWREIYDYDLADFISAALNYPTADRLIIEESSRAILAKKASTDISKNVRENKAIALAFKDVLRREYTRQLAGRLIPGQERSVWDSFSLSSATIFQCINKIEKRMTERNILRKEEADIEILRDHIERKSIVTKEAQEFYEKYQKEFDPKKTISGKIARAAKGASEVTGDTTIFGVIPAGSAVKGVAAVASNISKRPLERAKKIAERAKADLESVHRRLRALEDRRYSVLDSSEPGMDNQARPKEDPKAISRSQRPNANHEIAEAKQRIKSVTQELEDTKKWWKHVPFRSTKRRIAELNLRAAEAALEYIKTSRDAWNNAADQYKSAKEAFDQVFQARVSKLRFYEILWTKAGELHESSAQAYQKTAIALAESRDERIISNLKNDASLNKKKAFQLFEAINDISRDIKKDTYFLLRDLYNKAEEAEHDLFEQRKNILKLKNNTLGYEQAWQHLIEARPASLCSLYDDFNRKEKYANYIERAYDNFIRIFDCLNDHPWGLKNEPWLLEDAKYKKNFWNKVWLLQCDARRLTIRANESLQEALNLDYKAAQDPNNYLWKAAEEKAQQAQDIWVSVLNEYQKLKASISMHEATHKELVEKLYDDPDCHYSMPEADKILDVLGFQKAVDIKRELGIDQEFYEIKKNAKLLIYNVAYKRKKRAESATVTQKIGDWFGS